MIYLHMMLSLKTKIEDVIVKKLIMLMLLSEQATGNPHGPYRRPGSGWHHVGDPWFRFGTLGY